MSPVQEWLLDNRQRIYGYEPYEIVTLAVACGFSRHDVMPVLTRWILKSQRLLHFWESPLKEQWIELQMYEHGHTLED